MAEKYSKKDKKKRAAKAETAEAPGPVQFCSLEPEPPRKFDPSVDPFRASAIIVNDQKWVNGTVLNYCFLKSPAGIAGSEAQKQVVRKAFDVWTEVGIGIKFKETTTPDQAEVRIGFVQDGRSWSRLGRDILNAPRGQQTMNFGWDLTRRAREIDTAVHEIGHTLGLPHEHQNPKAGIVWNEEAVFVNLGGPPNNWPREQTHFNIIRKISPDTVQGSSWDPNSVMHYPFEAGLILEPAQFRNGLQPAGGLSARDKEWVKTFYPPMKESDTKELELLKSRPLALKAGEQANFTFKPTASRRYKIATFGASDTVMVLFEQPPAGDPIFMAGDDDSGENRNALIETRLIAGRTYIVRVRLFFAERTGETAIMIS